MRRITQGVGILLLLGLPTLFVLSEVGHPPHVEIEKVGEYVGKRVEVSGWVRRTRPTGQPSVFHLVEGSFEIQVFTRKVPPPLTSKVRVVGDVGVGRGEIPILSALRWTLERSPTEPLAVSEALSLAPHFEGEILRVKGRAGRDLGGWVLEEGGGKGLRADFDKEPKAQEWGVAEGRVRYRSSEGTYVLEVERWSPFPP